MKFKSGFVTVIGKTNVGKSSLINEMIGEQVSIVVNKTQTTRKVARGIYTDDEAQNKKIAGLNVNLGLGERNKGGIR